jgi:uncharacterized membrane protein
MPRVNRDLQRRMAARRERDRRRPAGERRYRFGTTEPGAEPDETTLVADDEATETADAAPPQAPTRPARDRAIARDGAGASRAPAPAKSAPKPFSAYRDEYAYVFTDLRRVAVVIGSLLLVLIVLYFVLPLLIH